MVKRKQEIYTKELLPSSHNQYLSDETSSTTVPQIIMHLAALTFLCDKEAQEGKIFILCSIWIMVHIGSDHICDCTESSFLFSRNFKESRISNNNVPLGSPWCNALYKNTNGTGTPLVAFSFVSVASVDTGMLHLN